MTVSPVSARVTAILVGVTLVLALVFPCRAEAQESQSAALAKELASLLEQRKQDCIAAHHPAAPDQFVAALYFPNQLLVVWARYVAPAALNEKLARKECRDVYSDLNSASIPDTKIFISDLGADGLRAKREENQPFDSQDMKGKDFRFDGNWREDKMSEEDYMKVYAQADESYAAALRALIAALKNPS